MRRPVLLTLAAIGGAIVLLGGTGIFAALSDTARSGTNSVESNALAASSDLQIATASLEQQSPQFLTCGSFSDNLVSPLITLTGPQSTQYFYCLRNVGSQTVSVTSLAEDLADVEVACTGDEINYDPTCGFGLGELGSFLTVGHQELGCNNKFPISGTDPLRLSANQTTPQSLGSIASGETRCFEVSVSESGVTEQDRQAAQSDRVTWRFAWTGQA